MGPECQIWTVNHKTDRVDIPIKYQGNSKEQPVIIEDGVWIGSRVTILPGVRVGKHSVVGAGAVVTKDISPYSVAVGNPAKVVKNRLENFCE
ncbi:acyltransferase [Clostridiaceae bacterium HFYG-1003]|nr:acyltransferase [Clostridiaceae bacterium HFYG-1003]